MKNKNILSAILGSIRKGWDRLGEPDIDEMDLNIDASTAEELKRIKAVQSEVHEKGSFVPKANVSEKKAQVTAKGKGRVNSKNQRVLGDA